MKKFSITVSDETDRLLKEWSEVRGQPKTTLAAFLVERGMEDARDRGYIKEAGSQPGAEAQRDPSPMVELLELIVSGKEIDPGAIARAARAANVSPQELAAKLNKLRNGNGERSRS